MSEALSGHTLVIEASTSGGSVALLRGAEVVCERDVEMRGRDEERLMPAVASCMRELEGVGSGLDRVVCGAGPGSFTSLRIAAAISKGICHARELPLFAVSSLALVLAGSPETAAGGRYMVAADAMRGESFLAVFELGSDGGIPSAAAVRLVSRDALEAEARSVGARVLEGRPRAAGAARMIESILRAGPVDLGSWEPDYGRAAEAQVKWEASHGRVLPR
jgi:tRNA threonylcarbamoyladenosine biosynthesis protein TsaB